MDLLVTAASAAPAGGPPPPPPQPGGNAPASVATSAIQAQLDAEIAQARADAAQAMAEAQADAAEAAAAAGSSVQVLPGRIEVNRDGKTVTVLTPDRDDFSGPDEDTGLGFGLFVLGVVALLLMFRAFKHWTAVQAGYPIRWGKRTIERGSGAETARGVQLLSGENEKLRQQVARLEERVAVLERIATDPARRLGAEIDALR